MRENSLPKLTDNGDRIEIFRHLAVDDFNNIDICIISAMIIGDNLESFNNFCEEVYNNKDNISVIKCIIEEDKLIFSIE